MALSLDGPSVAKMVRLVQRDHGTMPLVEAVTRRLGVESWTLRLDDAGRVRAVTVLATSLPAETLGDHQPSVPDLAAMDRPGDPLEGIHPLPAGGVLARLLGASGATGRQLADLALRHDDAEVRGEAIRVGVDALMREPVLEQRVLAAVATLDDAALARALEGIAGDASAGLLSVVVERARGRQLGRRAAQVLEQLRGR